MRRLRDAGQHKRANALVSKQIAAFANQGKGRLFGLNYTLVVGHIRKGDINAAESYAARNRSLLAEAQRWPVFPIYGANWQAMVEDGNARVAEARGRFADAEAAYRKAASFYTATLKTVPQWESKPPEGELERSRIGRSRWRDASRSSKDGSAKAKRTCAGRCSAASASPENSTAIPQEFSRVLVYVIQEQGRYQEAEQLQRQVIDIYQGLGYGVDSGSDGQFPCFPGSNSQPASGVTTRPQTLRPDRRLDREVGAVAPRGGQRRTGARLHHADARQLRQRAGDRPAHFRPRARQVRRQELQYRGRTRLSCAIALARKARRPKRCRRSRIRFRFC